MMARLRSASSSYGMAGVLLLLCAYFSWATYRMEYSTGQDAARELAAELAHGASSADTFVVVAQASETEFTRDISSELVRLGVHRAAVVNGDPPTVREQLETLPTEPGGAIKVATTRPCSQWKIWAALHDNNPTKFSRLAVYTTHPHGRSAFLSSSNLRNVADQISVIAIIAVGMTMVIISAGIDLSVGSLVALSAIITCWLIHKHGGNSAAGGAMLLSSLAAIASCGVVGAFSGWMITGFRIPPFIASLAMMQVASGLAFIIAEGQSIYDIPPSYTWLGRGQGPFTIPNSVLLMLLVYTAAHLFMTRTTVGRRIYAVGGNQEAARLSGVNTRRTLITVYLISGLMAGIGGVVTVSQLKAGAPTYGTMYELYVIAAVVVGGTSLTGGEGRIAGTLVGAFIIAVIQNGMNLVGVESYKQKVVLGAVILFAVMIDMMKKKKVRTA